LQELLAFFLKAFAVWVMVLGESLLDQLATFLHNLLFEACAQRFNVYLVLVFYPLIQILISQLPIQDPNPNHRHIPSTL